MMTINTNINTDYDVIIIGGGHNGMLCGAYLAKTGGNVLVLEKKHETGGGLVTEDFQSPFRFNLHATYMMMADVAPSHADLKLHDHSLQYITPETQIAFRPTSRRRRESGRSSPGIRLHLLRLRCSRMASRCSCSRVTRSKTEKPRTSLTS